MTGGERALHSAFIAHDRARYQLQQVITILGSDASTLVTLLEQVRDGYDLLPRAVRAHLESAHPSGSLDMKAMRDE